MRNYVIINGVSSLTIEGLAINIMPPITKPLMRNEIEEIDGRDGDIITELGYSAYDKEMEIGLWGNYDIDEIIKFFTGEGTVIFSTEPDKYYNFKILDQIDYEKLLKFRTTTVVFHCQPFKYPTDEEPIEVEPVVKTGEGETITIDDTYEGSLEMLLKGNTYQDSTTGKNLLNNQLTSGSTSNLTYTLNNDKSITINGTNSSASTIFVRIAPDFTLPAGTYTLSNGNSNVSNTTFIFYDDNWKFSRENISTKTFTEDVVIKPYIKINSGVTVNNQTIYPMIVSGSSAGNYEPYTNGASPNPDYPQEVHVVSGDNEVIVSNGDNTQSTTYPINLPEGMFLGSIGDYQDRFFKTSGKNLWGGFLNSVPRSNGGISYVSNENGTISASGTATANSQSITAAQATDNNWYITLSAGTYTLSGGISTVKQLEVRNINNTSIGFDNGSGFTFTLNEGTGIYIRAFISSGTSMTGTEIFRPQIEKGTKTSYEPYGSNDWYLEKKIGKVVLNGSESWALGETNTNTMRFVCNSLINAFSSTPTNYYTNYFEKVSQATQGTDDSENLCIRNDLSGIGIRALISRVTNLAGFKSWLGVNNTQVYYILRNSTYTKITGELESQLEEVYRAKSEEGQTNISQTNDDLPFWISATITFTPPSTINNIGNIYAKPILTITGSGNVGVVLNGIEILQINLGEGNTITIDVPNLEAYNPNDNTLMNRLVTGDYMKLLIQEGNNSLSFDGDVTSYSMTNYTRWI